MKNKFLLAAALVVVTSVSAFANTGAKPVPSYVLNAFNSDFETTASVTWESGAGYYKAAFIEAGIPVYVYYSANGDLMGVGRQLTTDMITLSLDKQLQKDYAGYKLTELYELGSEKSGDYLLVLQKDQQTLRLRTNDDHQLVAVK